MSTKTELPARRAAIIKAAAVYEAKRPAIAEMIRTKFPETLPGIHEALIALRDADEAMAANPFVHPARSRADKERSRRASAALDAYQWAAQDLCALLNPQIERAA